MRAVSEWESMLVERFHVRRVRLPAEACAFLHVKEAKVGSGDLELLECLFHLLHNSREGGSRARPAAQGPHNSRRTCSCRSRATRLPAPLRSCRHFSNSGLAPQPFYGPGLLLAMKRVLVASIPRCGSTMLFRAIAGLEPGSTMPEDYAGPHHKSHTFAPDSFAGRADVAVFLFGDVLPSVASTRKYRYTQQHFENCGAGQLSPQEVDIYDADHLNFERMFDAWMAKTAIPHVCVRYGQIHALAPIISELIGVPFSLPKKHRRRTQPADMAQEERCRIRRAYASLIHKISHAPDLSWWPCRKSTTSN